MKTLGLLLSFILGLTLVFGQSGVVGMAPVTLTQGAPDCNGFCATVDVTVDISGLQGTGGVPAGLNAFVLAFDLNRSDIFVDARAGELPQLDWFFTSTNRSLVSATQRVFVTGVIAESAAPNQSYQVATLIFCGTAGSVELSLVPSQSSLGSRWIAGDGPGPIQIQPPVTFQTSIQVNFPLSWGTGLQAWLSQNPTYDLVDPMARVDVLDLVKLVNCGEP